MEWYMLLPTFLGYGLLPFLTFFFFCRYVNVPFSWSKGVCYMLLSFCVCTAETKLSLKGSVSLLAEILLLACSSRIFLKRKWAESFTVSVLILSVLNVSSGMASWVGYRILLPFSLEYDLIQPSDTIRECLRLLLVCGLSTLLLSRFRQETAQADRQTLAQMAIPVFFISLVVRIIQTSVYGDRIQTDVKTGEILIIPRISHGEFLLLQIAACICLLVTWSAYQKILQIVYDKQKLDFLEQQAKRQEIYLQEAILRDQKTRAFRHDIKNHLTVLAELLKAGENDQACQYLACLEQASAELSYPVRTGNAAVDALLRIKLSLAEQKGIRVRCEMMLPVHSQVQDTDWCILLSNAIDNAVRACERIPKEEREIQIFSKRKKNFYLLTVENRCDQNLQKVPPDGIGLFNIRTVIERYQGRAENTVFEGTYCLQLFFGSLQQEKGVSHPSGVLERVSDDVEDKTRSGLS
ncbi:MAG TPA: hypothetical protein DD414_01215 [Lachnospiraceae bacterium]|nr:hypothetical protein [Lachnospiraceae bacterium]